jgi:hypothetical protein
MTAPVKMKRLNVDIPEALHRSLKVEAAAQGMSLQRLVTSLLDGTHRAQDVSTNGRTATWRRTTALQSTTPEAHL